MIRLAQISTKAPEELSKKDVIAKTEEIVEKIGELSRLFQAANDRALLIVLQGMDASGKDGTSREVFKFVSPTIVHAISFKKPTEDEMDHDFLWRVHPHTPGKGMIKVFNRSHYEDVLIQRVQGWITEEKVNDRFVAINHFELNLARDNQTTILKFFLNISRDKQREKLQERIDDPQKNWKHNPDDWKQAEKWADYQKCYEDVLNRSEIPWVVVPSDQTWYRNFVVAQKVMETLLSFGQHYPLLKDINK
ncbi:MAG TPA: polyphosphate kinase [Saprospiraceae bacterium]|nr:polyphosphate kinase [Saprospirales bacterium]HRQ30280.1 polyphosphate kinase [Saprospiraceae bacterium]